MSIINQRNKIKSLYNFTENNKIKIEQNPPIIVSSKTASFNKKKQEIILLDNVLASTSELNYLFVNVDISFIKYIKVLAFVENVGKFAISENTNIRYDKIPSWYLWTNDALEINFQYVWKMEENNLILHILFVTSQWEKTSSGAILGNRPYTYQTIKLIINNPQLYELIVK